MSDWWDFKDEELLEEYARQKQMYKFKLYHLKQQIMWN